ncbi:diaminopimelate epimerase [Armatimonas sp.]|uniref:diaminopimelate epimerase n=1 Tax=Armatimonas sp. TaxID=1872638 RepID=UPI00286C3E21|nr:diaminopimelate epimerase [Armatimonas sp.]
MTVPFVKMHGIGNDFPVFDHLQLGAPTIDQIQDAAMQLCDRRFGIGGDGTISVLPSEKADFAMRMFNPDGSEAEMCGNGIRCFAKYVFDRGLTTKTEISVETLAGIMLLDLTVEDSKVSQVRVDMGEPRLERGQIPMEGSSGQVLHEALKLDGEVLYITGVSMGNPHIVFFPEQATDELILRVGPKLETHPAFPKRTNVHAAQLVGRDELVMKIWERGAGPTLACGTGACAVGVAAHLNGLTGRDVLIHLPGGDLRIQWGINNHVYMTGSAALVYEGTIEL